MLPISVVVVGLRVFIMSTLVTTPSAAFVGAVVRSRGVRLSGNVVAYVRRVVVSGAVSVSSCESKWHDSQYHREQQY